MALRRMFDAAFPPASPPKWEAVAGYIGGNTPHVWTAAEWARQSARWRLPIFVRSIGGDPVADATFSINWLKYHGVPKGTILALDYETRIDATYLQAFDRAVVAAGWKVTVYGTRRTVLANPKPSGGYWDAQWTNVPHLNAGSAATQYGGDTTLGQPYDASLVADSTPLWDTEGGFTVIDADTKAYLDGKFKALGETVGDGVRLILRGDGTHPDNLAQIRAEIAAGQTVTLDLSAASPEQLDQLAALVAGHLAINGIGYEGTIKLTPSVAP